MLSDQDVAYLRLQGPTDDSLEWVAYFYNLAGVLGLPPARQVEVGLDLPRTTATKWIRRARDKGLLDGTTNSPAPKAPRGSAKNRSGRPPAARGPDVPKGRNR
jgi:hypothetical protein